MNFFFRKIAYWLLRKKRNELETVIDDLVIARSKDKDYNALLLSLHTKKGPTASFSKLAMIINNLAVSLESQRGFRRFQDEYYRGRLMVSMERWFDCRNQTEFDDFINSLHRINRVMIRENLSLEIIRGLLKELEDLIRIIEALPERRNT